MKKDVCIASAVGEEHGQDMELEWKTRASIKARLEEFSFPVQA